MYKQWIDLNINKSPNITCERTFTFVALSIQRSRTDDGFEKYVEYQVSHNIVSNRNLPHVRAMTAWWDEPSPQEKLGDAGYVGDRTKDVRYYDTDKNMIRRTPLVNVMLIEEKDSIARRLGIGVIYLARWKDAEPEMATIILE